MIEICGTTPLAWTLRQKTSPYPASPSTPSCMRAPAESLMPMIGQPIFRAASMILTILAANASPSEPPKSVKSCENTATRRPSIVPRPVITPSPNGRRFSIPNEVERCRTSASNSRKLPGSSSRSTRSRAESLPRALCFSAATRSCSATSSIRC